MASAHTANQGMNMSSFGRQSETSQNDMPMALSLDSMPMSAAMYGQIDPRFMNDGQFQQNIKNIRDAFQDPSVYETILRDPIAFPPWMERMFPLRPSQGHIRDEVFHSIVTRPTTAERINDLAMPGTVVYDETTRTISVEQVGKSLAISVKQMMTDAGQFAQRLSVLLETVMKAPIYSFIQLVHVRMKETKLLSHMIPGPNERDYKTLFSHEVLRWAAASLRKNGMEALLANIWMERSRLQGAAVPTIIVLGPGTRHLKVYGGENIENWRVGVSAERLISGEETPLKTFGGATVYEEGVYNVENADGTQMDPMTNIAKIGMHFTVPARNPCEDARNGNYSVRCNYSLVAHDAGSDELVEVRFPELISKSPYYMPDGSLNRSGIETLLMNYESIAREYGTNVPMDNNNMPKIDPHVAFMVEGDSSNPRPYAATFTGESPEWAFSQDKLDSHVNSARAYLTTQCSEDTIQKLEWLRGEMLRAYRGSSARIKANIDAMYPDENDGLKADKRKIRGDGADIFALKDTDAIGMPAWFATKATALSALEPKGSPLPDGAATFTWAYFLAQDMAKRRSNVPDEKAERFVDAVMATEKVARELINIYDKPSLSGPQNRNAVCTVESLPMHQIPTGAGYADSDKSLLELFAVAQNALFFVGLPRYASLTATTAATATAASGIPVTAGVDVALYPNGTANPPANFEDNFGQLLNVILSTAGINEGVKNYLSMVTPQEFYQDVTKPFLDAYNATTEKPAIQDNVDTVNGMLDFVENVIFKKPGRALRADEMTGRAYLFVSFVQDIRQNNDRFFSKSRLVNIQKRANNEMERLGEIGVSTGLSPYTEPVSANAFLLTAFVQAPTQSQTGAAIPSLNPFNSARGVYGADRQLARGLSNPVDNSIGAHTIFSTPSLFAQPGEASTSGAYDGSMSMHGGAGFDDPLSGSHAITTRSVQNIPEGSTVLSPGVIHTALLNPTFARRITAAGKRNNVISRACEICALTTPFNSVIFKNMYNLGVEPLVTLKVFYPNVTFKMNCAYLGVDNVGARRVEFPNAIPSFGSTGMVIWRFEMHIGANVLNDRDVSVVHNTMFRSYLGGMRVASLTKYHITHRHSDLDQEVHARYGDGFVTTVGVSYDEPSPILDITGVFVSRSHQGLPVSSRQIASQMYEHPQYAGALFHNQFLKEIFSVQDGSQYGMDNVMTYRDLETWTKRSRNTLCHAGRQWAMDSEGHAKIVRNGWGFGRNIVPGRMQAVYSGMEVLNTELPVRMIEAV